MNKERTGQLPNRNYGGETPEQRKERRRARFIAAGKVLFGSIGYRKTTVRALCAESGLTDRYFYESFATLEDLLIAVYEELVAEMQGRILAALQAAGPAPALETLVDLGLDAYFRHVEDARAARVMWVEVLGVSPRVDQVYNQGIHRFADLLTSLGQGGSPTWQVPGPVARVMAMALVGAASEAAKSWLLEGYRQPREHLVEGTALLFRGVLLLARQAPGP